MPNFAQNEEDAVGVYESLIIEFPADAPVLAECLRGPGRELAEDPAFEESVPAELPLASQAWS